MQKAINSRQILCILLAIPELKSPELAVLPPPEEPQKINPFSFEAFIMEIWDRIRPGGLLLCSTSSRGNSWSLLTKRDPVQAKRPYQNPRLSQKDMS